jgi:hypothetical protein
VLATPFGDLSDTDMWSSTQSTGSMTPTDPGSDGDDELTTGYNADIALEDLLEPSNEGLMQKYLARLVFHWTNVGSFGGFERHELMSPL